jgi:hypothetical protein
MTVSVLVRHSRRFGRDDADLGFSLITPLADAGDAWARRGCIFKVVSL